MRATTTQRGAGGAGAAAATPAVSGADLQDTIDQLNDRAEIAKIQLDIFGQLQTMLQSVCRTPGTRALSESLHSPLAPRDSSGCPAVFMFCFDFVFPFFFLLR
jgi:hypothetical protein